MNQVISTFPIRKAVGTSMHKHWEDFSLLNPRNEYDYPSFEEMCCYRIDFIKKQTWEQVVNIVKYTNCKSSYRLLVWSQDMRVSEIPLRIFCYLSRFEWNVIPPNLIILQWLSSMESLKEVDNKAVTKYKQRWNKSVPLLPIQIIWIIWRKWGFMVWRSNST